MLLRRAKCRDITKEGRGKRERKREEERDEKKREKERDLLYKEMARERKRVALERSRIER